MDGTLQPITGANTESKNDASIDQALAEKATLNRSKSTFQAGQILTGRQEHCTEVLDSRAYEEC